MHKLLFLLAGLVFSASVRASDEGARIEFLDTWEQVVANSCLTDPPGYFKDCGATRSKMAAIYLPRRWAELVVRHVDESYHQGFASEVSPMDLFHGHLIMKNKGAVVTNVDELYEGFQALVYHSAERIGRWEKEGRQGIPFDQRNPRSYVGWLDGMTQKAIDLMTPGIRLKSYETAGTIYTEEVVQARPELVNDVADWTNFGGSPLLQLNACRPNAGCQVCKFDWVANIAKMPNGRFVTSKGERVDVFSRCRFPGSF